MIDYDSMRRTFDFWPKEAAGHGQPSSSAPTDPHLKALLARFVDTLEVTSAAVDDLTRDLASDNWRLGPS